MQNQSKILHVESVTSNSLLDALSDLLDQKFSKFNGSSTPKNPDAFITRQDVADLFKISLPTVHSWMNVGILTPYKIGNKTRFLLSEVKAAAVLAGGKREVSHV
ncbi:helix-turn-helix domain-containing protein [Flavitalea flava]